jgi:hypothetical protein
MLRTITLVPRTSRPALAPAWLCLKPDRGNSGAGARGAKVPSRFARGIRVAPGGKFAQTEGARCADRVPRDLMLRSAVAASGRAVGIDPMHNLRVQRDPNKANRIEPSFCR